MGNLTHNILSRLGGTVLGAQDRGEKAVLFQGYSVSHDWARLADALYIQEDRDTVLTLGLNEQGLVYVTLVSTQTAFPNQIPANIFDRSNIQRELKYNVQYGDSEEHSVPNSVIINRQSNHARPNK